MCVNGQMEIQIKYIHVHVQSIYIMRMRSKSTCMWYLKTGRSFVLKHISYHIYYNDRVHLIQPVSKSIKTVTAAKRTLDFQEATSHRLNQ